MATPTPSTDRRESDRDPMGFVTKTKYNANDGPV